jgi:hypothetical protein
VTKCKKTTPETKDKCKKLLEETTKKRKENIAHDLDTREVMFLELERMMNYLR